MIARQDTTAGGHNRIQLRQAMTSPAHMQSVTMILMQKHAG
jgi:hypothetical protein